MLRSFFIYLSKSKWARRIVTSWTIGWRMASRFVSGETLEDAVKVIQELNAKGINATLDHLGEHTETLEGAQKATTDILEALDAICDSGVNANVSIKLTQIGLNIDRSVCEVNLKRILTYAAQCENFIRVDMEDSSATQITLDLVTKLKREGWDNIGVVIQVVLEQVHDPAHDGHVGHRNHGFGKITG